MALGKDNVIAAWADLDLTADNGIRSDVRQVVNLRRPASVLDNHNPSHPFVAAPTCLPSSISMPLQNCEFFGSSGAIGSSELNFEGESIVTLQGGEQWDQWQRADPTQSELRHLRTAPSSGSDHCA